MESVQTILWFLVAIIVLVTIHEFGHFYVARRCGVRVLRFSIGFGPVLLSVRDKLGTEYSLSAIPLGGYVKMLDEREGEVAKEDLPYAFTQKNVWQRIAIVAAGPLANFILAIFLFWILLIPGKTDVIPVIGAVEPDSVAAQAGLEVGQEIVSIDGVKTPTQQAVVRHLVNRLGETGALSFSVKYPDSDWVYASDGQIENWLHDTDEPDPLAGIGLKFQLPPVLVGEIIKGGAAEAAGFQIDDRIMSADGEPMDDWQAWRDYVSARPDQSINVTVERKGESGLTTLNVVPKPQTAADGQVTGLVGLGGKWDESYLRQYHYSIPEAFVQAVAETGDLTVFVLTSIKKLIVGEISTKNLSGPITIAKVAGSSAQGGWMNFVSFLALLSVSLGVFNLLPIPVLDGGHLLYYIVEIIKGSPVSEKIQLVGYQVGLFLIVGVMVLAIYNDVLRL